MDVSELSMGMIPDITSGLPLFSRLSFDIETWSDLGRRAVTAPCGYKCGGEGFYLSSVSSRAMGSLGCFAESRRRRWAGLEYKLGARNSTFPSFNINRRLPLKVGAWWESWAYSQEAPKIAVDTRDKPALWKSVWPCQITFWLRVAFDGCVLHEIVKACTHNARLRCLWY